MTVHRQMRPKPSKLLLHRLMRRHQLTPRRCILVEDTLANLRSARDGHAHRLGHAVPHHRRHGRPGASAKTLIRPAYVDVKVKSVRNLPARLHRLR
jgi:putative hydrolase of the HAD superfamily